MKYPILITLIIFPLIAFCQKEILFKVNISDSTRQYYPLDFLNLEISLINNTQGRLQYYPIKAEDVDFLFNQTTIEAFVIGKGKSQKVNRFGIYQYGKPKELLKGKGIIRHGIFFPICDDKPCFIKPGEYKVILKYYPFTSKNKGQLIDELILQDSFNIIINSYSGIDQQAFEFLQDKIPLRSLKHILSIKYYERYSSPAFILYANPQLVPLFESFVDQFQDSSFTPWIIVRLAFAYLFDPSFSRLIEGSPNYRKSEAYLKQLESYEIAKSNERLRKFISYYYYELKRTQKFYKQYQEKNKK